MTVGGQEVSIRQVGEADEMFLGLIEHVEAAEVEGDDPEFGELPGDCGDAVGRSEVGALVSEVWHGAAVNGDDHGVADFLVEREHGWVVGVEAVEDGVELDALQATGADASELGGLVVEKRVDGTEGDDG